LIARPKMATFAQYLAVITQSGPHIEHTRFAICQGQCAMDYGKYLIAPQQHYAREIVEAVLHHQIYVDR
jgi:hypothetical protein